MFGRASQGFASGYKKAIVTLAEGQQIELVEGV
jgi:ribosomal protein L23